MNVFPVDSKSTIPSLENEKYLWTPSQGESCEYQLHVGQWIQCAIVTRRNDGKFIAIYVDDRGNQKTGAIDLTNLRKKPN